MIPCIFNWSGGKDSALALYHCLQNPEWEIRYLVTTINDEADRISMHGVRTELLLRQAEQIGIPLYQIRLPEMPDMDTYDNVMREHLERLKNEGITHSIFGDIFLEDLKVYRDARLAEVGLTGIYPLWKRNTNAIIDEFFNLGFGTVIACVQDKLKKFLGREMSEKLVAELPDDVDVCGENGEFHTFTFKGPIFKTQIKYQTGVRVFKNYNAPKRDDVDAAKGADIKHAGVWYIDLKSA